MCYLPVTSFLEAFLWPTVGRVEVGALVSPWVVSQSVQHSEGLRGARVLPSWDCTPPSPENHLTGATESGPPAGPCQCLKGYHPKLLSTGLGPYPGDQAPNRRVLGSKAHPTKALFTPTVPYKTSGPPALSHLIAQHPESLRNLFQTGGHKPPTLANTSIQFPALCSPRGP